jgi:hypothetical protein
MGTYGVRRQEQSVLTPPYFTTAMVFKRLYLNAPEAAGGLTGGCAVSLIAAAITPNL